MTYQTIHGKEIEYNHAIALRVHGSAFNVKSKEAKAWMDAYSYTFNQLVNIDRECVSLREENSRLRHENEFMLRLINDRNQDT